MSEIIDALVSRYLNKLVAGPTQAEIGMYGDIGHAQNEIHMKYGQTIKQMERDGLYSLAKFMHDPNPRIREKAEYLCRDFVGEANVFIWRAQRQADTAPTPPLDFGTLALYDLLAKSENVGVRIAVAQTLGDILTSDQSSAVDLNLAVPALVQALQQERDVTAQLALIDAISASPHDDRLRDAMLWLYDTDPRLNVRHTLLSALAVYPSERVIRALVDNLLGTDERSDPKLATLLARRHIELYKAHANVTPLIEAGMTIARQGYGHNENWRVWNDVIAILEAAGDAEARTAAEQMRASRP